MSGNATFLALFTLATAMQLRQSLSVNQ